MDRGQMEGWIRSALLPKLNLRGNFDAHHFTERLAKLKEKPIKLSPYSFPPGSGKTGMLLYNLDKEQYEILYEKNTTWTHQQAIIFHEDAHILFGHQMLGVTQEELDIVVKYLNAAHFETIFRESACSKTEEKEAELFASLMIPISFGSSPKRTSQIEDKDYSNLHFEEEVVIKILNLGKWSGSERKEL